MRVQLLYDVKGWAYHNRCLALKRHAPPEFDIDLAVGNRDEFSEDYRDLYLQLCYSRTNQLREHIDKLGQKSQILSGCNTGWCQEGSREGRFHFRAVHDAADWVVFNNRAAWGLAGRLPRTSWVSNGVDRDIFHVRKPIKDRPSKVIWVGSTYHTKPDRDVKGYHSTLSPLRYRLEARGYDCDFQRVCVSRNVSESMGYRTAQEMADWYNDAAVYVCASVSEGTPNPALEAAACGCTLVTTPCGNMPELVQHGINGMLSSRDVDCMEAAVLDALENRVQMAEAMQESIAPWGWEERSKQYYELFRYLLP